MIPLYASSLGANELVIGLIVSVSQLFALLCNIPIGCCSSYVGLERMLKLAFLIGVGSGVMYIFATSPNMLILPQIGFGLTLGLFMPQMISYCYRISTPVNRQSMQGYNTAFQGLGFLVGPFIAGIVGQYLGLRWIFVFYTLFSAVGYIICRFLRPLDRYVSPAPLHHIAFSSFSQAVAIIKTKKQVKEALLFIVLISTLWQGLGNTVFPLYIEKSFPGIFLLVGILITTREAAATVMRLLFASVSRFLSLQVILVLCVALMAVGSFAIPISLNPITIAFSSLVIGIGLGLSFPSLNLLILDSVDEEKGSLAMASANSFSRITLMTIAPVLGIMVKAYGFQISFQSVSIICILILSGYLLINRISISPQEHAKVRG